MVLRVCCKDQVHPRARAREMSPCVVWDIGTLVTEQSSLGLSEQLPANWASERE